MTERTEYTTFKTPSGRFEWNIPSHWAEYDDDEGTFAFFNTREWTGNLRITPLTVKNAGENTINRYVKDELNSNAGATSKTLGLYPCAYYVKLVERDEETLFSHYWITGQADTVFICSFTTDRTETDPNLGNEIEVVENIIESIQGH